MNVISIKEANRKSALISRLEKEILPLYGLRNCVNGTKTELGLGEMNHSFPGGIFPLGAVHEFITASHEDNAASAGFISGLISPLLKKGGISLWISADRTIFPAALKSFGIQPDQVLFIDLKKPKDLLWAMDEGLKCEAVTTVVGEIPELSFTLSRRLQLAVERSQVTGFIIRRNPRNLQTTACVTRWKISPVASEQIDDLPGLGYPTWKVELLKVRNGKPGSWLMSWKDGKFEHITEQPETLVVLNRQTG